LPIEDLRRHLHKPLEGCPVEEDDDPGVLKALWKVFVFVAFVEEGEDRTV
jgi:hypothetical protein